MQYDLILNGVHIGEHSFDKENIISEIKSRCVDTGFNLACLRPQRCPSEIEQEYFVKWAEYLASNKIYFMFLYATQFPPKGKESWLTAETVEKMKEVAGEYYLGELLGEPGSQYACKLANYYAGPIAPLNAPDGAGLDFTRYASHRNYRLRGYDDMKSAASGYISILSNFVTASKKLGTPKAFCVEASALARLNALSGIDIPILELCPGNPDVLIPFHRGTARAFNSEKWGTYIAHEWYGGLRHNDTLKMKRVELAYKYAYLSGSMMFMLESGESGVNSYGERFDENSAVCANYSRVLADFKSFLKNDKRPSGGPKTKVAFVSGLYDAFAGKWGRSCLYNQFFKEEWGYGDAENSWRLLFELNEKRSWSEPENYGDYDTSSSPAYGQFDVVPIEADLEFLSGYDYLIFLGWNSMTEENMKKLTEYVRRGGHLVMSAAHLNTQVKRDGEYTPVCDELIEELFGCRHLGEYQRRASGVKFKHDSLDSNLKYPRYKNGGCDPMFTAGYADYLRFLVTDGKTVAYLADAFAERPYDTPAVIENKVGDGVATLFTSTNYPGAPAVYYTYRSIVREIISASHRECDIKLIGSDRVRYAVYEGNKVYLLNTDYDMPIKVKLIHGESETEMELSPLELKSIQL